MGKFTTIHLSDACWRQNWDPLTSDPFFLNAAPPSLQAKPFQVASNMGDLARATKAAGRWQAHPEPVHPERVSVHGFAYNHMLPGHHKNAISLTIQYI